ncbi:hypothetical protein BZG36_04555 [Bifiguratus adelaidae]|uniref:Pentacotripeptide-repeat region of PRORP domain-containing protein n=1 Tax=Bifiguratus adelaidae TaxID=1938954 RepID=A0A261XX43_9FUNG|nr:hypothetical protein BZG36_04555 [Bifiguratus adelaidae]
MALRCVVRGFGLLRSQNGARTLATSSIARIVQGTRLPARQAAEPTRPRYSLPQDPYQLSLKVTRLIKSNRWDEAFEAVKAAPIPLQSTVVWNQIIDGCARSGRSNAAFDAYLEVSSNCVVTKPSLTVLHNALQMKRRGFTPSEVTYGSLLNALGNSKTSNARILDRIDELIKEMKYNNIQFNHIHFNSILKAYARNGSIEQLQVMYITLLQDTSVTPDVVTYSTLINACAKGGGDGGYRAAFNVLRLMAEQSTSNKNDSAEHVIDDEFGRSLLLACKNADSKELISASFDIASLLYGLPTNPRVSILSESDKRALQTVFNGTISTMSVKTLQTLLSACFKLRQHDKVAQHIQAYKDHYPDQSIDVHTYNSLLLADLIMGRPKAVFATFEDMKQHAQPDELTYQYLLQTCASTAQTRSGSFDTASQILAQAVDAGVELNLSACQSYMACALQGAYNTAAGKRTIKEALETMEGQNWLDKVQHAKYSQPDKAIFFTRQMLKAYKNTEGWASEHTKNIQHLLQELEVAEERRVRRPNKSATTRLDLLTGSSRSPRQRNARKPRL